MARKRSIATKKATNFSVYILVDGDCERDYLNSIRRHSNYASDFRTNIVNIKPEIPSRKSLENQFEELCKALTGEYNRVIWIVDYDVILKQSSQQDKGQEKSCDKLLKLIVKLEAEANSNGKDAHVLINNPSIEFWYLLHFIKTSKLFIKSESVENELRKHFLEYTKADIKVREKVFEKLHNKLDIAIINARQLDKNNSDMQARADIYKLFEDNLKLLKR